MALEIFNGRSWEKEMKDWKVIFQRIWINLLIFTIKAKIRYYLMTMQFCKLHYQCSRNMRNFLFIVHYPKQKALIFYYYQPFDLIFHLNSIPLSSISLLPTFQTNIRRSQFPIYYRRMTETPSRIFLAKLVSKIAIPQQPVRRSTRLKQTNFAKYNRSMYLQNYRSFRATKQQRFHKHNNLIQTNKQNMMKMHSPKHKTPNHSKLNIQNLTRIDCHATFTPKREQQIRDRHYKPESESSLSQNAANLQFLLQKNRMKNNRNLLGFNILHLQKQYNYSRFQLHTLHSIYSTLLLDSKHSLSRFKDSFQVMLNMNRINIRPQILQKIFKQQQVITFESFIQMYSKIDQFIFKQNIIDYVQILFEGVYNKDNIRFEDIVRILKGRITEKEAIDIASIIYEQYDRNFDEWIKLSEIAQLCHCCQNFAKKMYRLYTSQMRCD